MARGFFLGALTGVVMAGGVGTLASVMAPAPRPDTLVFSDVAPAAVDNPAVTAQAAPVASAEESAPPASPSVVLGATPDADTLAEVETTVEQPTRLTTSPPPSEIDLPAAFDAPEVTRVEGGISVAWDDPEIRSPLVSAPEMPGPGVAPPFDPLSTPRGVVGQASVVVLAREVPEEDDEIQVASAATPLLPQVAPLQPIIPSLPLPERVATESVPAVPRSESPSVPVAPSAVIPDVPAVQSAPAAPGPDVTAQLAPQSPVTPEDTQATPPDPAPDAMQAPANVAVAPAPRPQIGKPAVSLTDRPSRVVVNRLGTSAAPEAEEAPETEGEEAATDTRRPVERFAQVFENPEAKPLMSVLLIDSGDAGAGAGTNIDALREFPYTLSFAVDSTLPDAAERIAMYRDAGFEVMGMIDLPPGALPTDAETTLGVLLPQMGEIVGVLEGTDIGLQENREVSDQVTAILAQSGHGLVSQDRGLNTMPNLARKEGVPAQAIFRDFDGKGQDARVIRRFLDQAAFKAGQEGAVIMLGRLREETVSALLVWGLQDRAGQVALAPISAVLLRE